MILVVQLVPLTTYNSHLHINISIFRLAGVASHVLNRNHISSTYLNVL